MSNEHAITDVRTMFDSRAHFRAAPQPDGSYVVTVTRDQYMGAGEPRKYSFEIRCECFRIDSTLRPVFEFSARYPRESFGGHMDAYVPPFSPRKDRGFVMCVSPSGDDKDFIKARCNGDDTVSWLRSELWEDLDSSAVEERGKYNVSAGTFSLFTKEAVNGLSCSGFDIAPNGDIVQPYDGTVIASFGSDHYAHVLVECAVTACGMSAGGEFDESGNNHAKLTRAARSAL